MRYWAPHHLLLTFLLLLTFIGVAWPSKVVEVIDGDTLTLNKVNTKVEVRHYGIDTPENNQPYEIRATRFTKMMARFERVEGEPGDRDHMDGLWPWSTLMVIANASTKNWTGLVTPGSISGIATFRNAMPGRSWSDELGERSKGSGHSPILCRLGIEDIANVVVPVGWCAFKR